MVTDLSNVIGWVKRVKDDLYTMNQAQIEWPHPPQRLLIIKKSHDEDVNNVTAEFIEWLIEKDIEVYVEYNILHHDGSMPVDEIVTRLTSETQSKLKCLSNHTSSEELLLLHIDLIISLGGDGTILHIASLFQRVIPPVMAFHLGSLGFLTAFNIQDYQQSIQKVIYHPIRVILRMRIHCTLSRGNVEASPKQMEMEVLNEMVVDRGPSSYMLLLEMMIDEKFVTMIQADGLIIATPTGSTAYSLAAGGAIVHPEVPCFLITPICAHTLSFRPLVLPSTSVIQIRVPMDSRARSVWASFDGRARTELQRGDSIFLHVSSWPLPTVCQEDSTADWFQRLSACLHWNLRAQQKALFHEYLQPE
jgi:NAD+ kinase